MTRAPKLTEDERNILDALARGPKLPWQFDLGDVRRLMARGLVRACTHPTILAGDGKPADAIELAPPPPPDSV